LKLCGVDKTVLKGGHLGYLNLGRGDFVNHALTKSPRRPDSPLRFALVAVA
jgi:hypothetical protein